MEDTQRSETISTKLQRIAEQAVQYPRMVFTTLVHHIDAEFLKAAFKLLRKDAAAGVDGVKVETYAENLEQNLADLLRRLKTNQYRAQPVERVWIDKENGKKRPIGITALEDKIVQRAVVMLLEQIYEQDFYDFSYGFRRERSQHQALHAIRECCMNLNIKFILDLDIRGFFDSISHGKLREVLKWRVNDGGILRLVGKWLNAGVLEGESISYAEEGTPQGAVISPLLSNIYLHYALDRWFELAVKPRLKGRCFIIRFADDATMGFECREDAERVLEVLPKRLAKYSLQLNLDKTKLVRFGKPRNGAEAKEMGCFNFLGFTHFWAKARSGFWVIKRKTMSKRINRFLTGLWDWCKDKRHDPFLDQYREFCSKLRGHYGYYAVRCNMRSLEAVFIRARQIWRHWLKRRSNEEKPSWQEFEKLLKKFPLPKPIIIHSI